MKAVKESALNQLRDNFGRRFEYLRLSVTDVCNFRCDYCLPDGYQKSQPHNFLSLEEIDTLVRAFANLGMRKIRITGGEPGLRRDLNDIIQICKRTPNIEQVVMTSNGYRLPRVLPSWIESGLDSLNLSVDSLNPNTFNLITGHDRLQDILDGIEVAKQLDFNNIKFNAVLMKQKNLSVVDEYLSWVKSHPITVRFIELMETGENRQFFQDNHFRGDEVKQRLLNEGWQPVIRDRLSGPAEEFYHPEYLGRVGLIMPYSKDFCESCNRLRVTARGQLHLCLFANQGVDLRDAISNGDVSAVEARLLAAMQDKKVSHELQSGIVGATKHLAMLGG